MRVLLCCAALVGLLAGAPPAQAQGAQEVRLKVGEAYQLRLDYVPMGIVCDDTSIVRIEDGKTHLRLVGVAPGKTKCGFWRDPRSPTPDALYAIEVTTGSPTKK